MSNIYFVHIAMSDCKSKYWHFKKNDFLVPHNYTTYVPTIVRTWMQSPEKGNWVKKAIALIYMEMTFLVLE